MPRERFVVDPCNTRASIPPVHLDDGYSYVIYDEEYYYYLRKRRREVVNGSLMFYRPLFLFHHSGVLCMLNV